MKPQKTSGNKAASPETTISSPVVSKSTQQQLDLRESKTMLALPEERYTTLAYISQRFGMAERTIRRNVQDGMPSHPIGRRGIRFLVSEVQRWLDKNGRKRFAAIGRAATREELQKRIAVIPILEGLEIVDGQRAAAGAKNLALEESVKAGEFPLPKCKPGRKPQSKNAAACDQGRHKWRTAQYTRTCSSCGRTEERGATNKWVLSV